MNQARRACAVYLAVISLAGLAWWIGLALSRPLRELFLTSTLSERALQTLAASDLIVFVGAAGVGSALLLAGRRGGALAATLHAGGAWYAGLWTISAALMDGEGALGAVLMGLAMLGSAWCAVTACRLEHEP